MNPWYTDYSDFLKRKFPGLKVQKISIDAGFSCPNRDGTIGRGGCIYCNARSFTPGYCTPSSSVTQQLADGRAFFGKKYPDMKYLAYFQSYTNTYGDSQSIKALFEEAVAAPDVVGLVIGTRPDCMPDDLLFSLADMNKHLPVIIEYGAETSHDATLARINRGHKWADVVDAVKRTADVGISCGLHFIAYLPGENAEDVIETVDRAVQLPIDSLKMHQLQVIRDTTLQKIVEAGEIELHSPSVEEYIDLCCRIIAITPRRIALERFVAQAPADFLVSPRWGLKNYQFTNLLHNKLKETNNL